ncbi:TlpA family protein disulfide reductase [Actinospongicola halichondriae]|uniref:TlpA family protein disulfide reductase n=1 Tax=Actinospongicola halichondriae TaxID=3236844 RepID=UPI003D5C1FEF
MSAPSRLRSALPWQAVVAATVLALTAAALVLVIAGGNDDEASVESGGTTVELRPDDGEERDVLDVEFTDVDGTTGTIRDLFDGTPMVVNFFASWCPPCIGELPDFEAVSQQMAGRVEFFGLAVQDRPEDASGIIDDTGVTYDWSRDIRGDIVGAAEIVQMPSTMFISADGEVVEIQGGALDADRLRSLIEEHLGVST